MKIMVLGDTGLLGRALAETLNEEFDVVGLSRSTEKLPWSHFGSEINKPQDLSGVVFQATPDIIVNCLAATNVDLCETSRKAQIINSHLPEWCCDLSEQVNARLFHISTDSVFANGLGADESSATSPVNAYATQKLNAEQRVVGRGTVFRVNFFGLSHGLAAWILSSLSSGTPIRGFTDVYFSPLYNYYLAETIRDFILLDVLHPEIFHVVASSCVSKFDFALEICRQFGFSESLIEPVSLDDIGLVAARPKNTCISNEKASVCLGKSLPTVSAGIERMHKDWSY